jgi:predicted phage tail protein
MDPTTRDRQRFARRGRHGVLAGLVAGGLLGAVVGALIGGVGFQAGSAAMWAATLGGCIFGAGVGAFAGGLSRLDSPPPGRESSEEEDPLRRPGLTRDEHDRGAGGSR